MLSEVFWTFFITSLAGFLLKCASMAYKSKCKEVDVCCIKIIRDTETEQEEMEFDRLHPPITKTDSEKAMDRL
jgi:hypothetical protein